MLSYYLPYYNLLVNSVNSDFIKQVTLCSPGSSVSWLSSLAQLERGRSEGEDLGQQAVQICSSSRSGDMNIILPIIQ